MSGGNGSPVFRLLLVEDNDADVYLIDRVLKRAGVECEMTVVADGDAALAYLRNPDNRGDGRPDLAVLDLNLPKKGGAEVLEAIRGDSELATIPVAVMSSSSSPQEKARLENLGIERYITKGPDLADFDKIGAAIAEIVGKTGRAR
jgi:CheY-like chemotaxis protein